MTKEILLLSVVVAVCTIAYSFLASERIAIIELAIAASFAPVAFRMRASFFRAAAPLIGILGVFLLFALGEYFRSWSFFRGTGVGFLEFAVTRFAGYFASSINNGAGIFIHLDHPNIPYFSAIWYYRFPIWSLIGFDVGQSPLEALSIYLTRFGSLEFNNYSGIYAPLQDFGLGLGCFVMFTYGFLGGALYRNFASKGVLGLLLHPIWVMGYFDIIRIFYWGEPRFIPNLISALVLWAFLRNGSHRKPLTQSS